MEVRDVERVARLDNDDARVEAKTVVVRILVVRDWHGCELP